MLSPHGSDTDTGSALSRSSRSVRVRRASPCPAVSTRSDSPAPAVTIGKIGTPASIAKAAKPMRPAKTMVLRSRHDLDPSSSPPGSTRTWRDRNTIVFAGRMGFAALAMEAGVPILPIVTAGAGESLLVLTAGQGLARLTRTDRLLRLKALPVSVSLPWGLNIGAVGLLPYLPLPTKLVTAVLPAMRPAPGESADQLARRVQEAMQAPGQL